MSQELMIPPEAELDKDAFELLRAWAANGELHVTIESGLNGEAADYGCLIADLVLHGARLYSERDNISIEKARQAILSGMNERFEEEPEVTGSIPTEH